MGRMLLFKVIKGINSFPCKCKNFRFRSTHAASENTVKASERKYLKDSTPRELRPWLRSNLHNIFAGTIDKRVFEYPTILTEEGFETVLDHSANVESYLSLNRSSKLTNDVLEKLKELELFGLTVSQKYGGAGYGETDTKYLLECTGCNPTIARFLGYNEDFGCRLINMFGSEEQKQKYLPDLASGNRFVALAYLENSPIINLQRIQGYVISDLVNSKYILNAEKKWVHYADKADLFLVLAKESNVTEDLEANVKFNMLLVDKKTPGVTVHELKSKWAEEHNLYEVSFKDISLPLKNSLGDGKTEAYDVLKYGLSHSNLTDSILILSLMKQMLFDAVQFVQERNLQDVGPRGQLLVEENTAMLVSYIYALESVIYLLTGNSDMDDKPDLFLDSIMSKILAVDFLQAAIQLYTEIIGRESFKNSRIIKEAIETLQYYSVFEENIENLKLLGAAEGLLLAATKLAKRVNILLKPFDNPYEVIKIKALRSSETKKFKSQLKFRMELHSSFFELANIVEDNYILLLLIVEELFIRNGSFAIQCEHSTSKMAEIASYLFATIACLSRASSSTCYDLKNFENEFILVEAFTNLMNIKIDKLIQEELRFPAVIGCYRSIGKSAFNFKEYPLEHPLARAV